MKDEYGNWCDECGRRLGVSCTCGLSFRERVSGVNIDKASLKGTKRKEIFSKTIGEES